jgi:hypothetical protein
MAIRLQGGFRSRKENDQYVFNIHDSSYAGTVIDFDLGQDGIIEIYDPEDKGRNQAILTSSMEIRLLVKNSSIETFIEDAANAAEGRFKLEVLKNGNKYWYGYILPDQFVLNDLPYSVNPVLKLRATDGISRLKDIDYNNSGTAYSGKATFLDHLYNVLGKIDLQDFYGSTEDYLITYVDWWDENHVYDATTDPYNLSRFDHKALIRVDNSGEVVYSSAYDVLEQIVKAWNCRFLYSDGTYKLIQINAYQTDSATKVLKVYDKNKNATTTSTSDLSIWNKTTGLLDNFEKGTRNCFHNKGDYKYYPALRETQVEYEHFATENLIPGQTWTQATAQTATYNDIDFNDGAAALNFSAVVSYRADWTTPSELKVMTYWFQFQIKVGSYYLRRNYTVNGGRVVPGIVEWTTTPGYYNYFPSVYMYSNNSLYTLPISFDTPPLEEGGQLDVTITRAGAYDSEGQQVFMSSSDFTPYYTFSNVSVQVLVEGNLADQTNVKVYNATNDDGSTNSKKEVVPILVGDGPSGNTFGAIEVYDSGNTEWVNSTGWRVGNSGDYTAFGQLLANQILAGQKVAIKRYFGEVTGDYVAHGRLRRYGGASIINFVFVGGRHSLHEDRWNGEWFIIDVDPTGITEETPRDFTDTPRIRPDKGFTVPKPVIDIINGVEGQPEATPTDLDTESPVQIPIDGPLEKDTEISTIPIDAIASDGYIFEGDIIQIITPTGEVINVRVTEDVEPGDTSVSVVPVTPDIDIPEGSVLSVSKLDLYAYIQRSRNKQLSFYTDFRFSDIIVDNNPLFFFRVDEQSPMYLNTIKQVEVQVYVPGESSGTFDYSLKVDQQEIASKTVSETTELSRMSLSYPVYSGLYSMHISNITGTIPIGINFLIHYVEPLQKASFVDQTQSIAIEYASDSLAMAGGVKNDKLYSFSINNIYGMPWGLVARLYSSIGFPSDEKATVIDTDEWYAVSVPNDYGVPITAVRSKSYSGTTYADDSAAASGGIDVDEPYILSAANPYGIPAGFVKLRKV